VELIPQKDTGAEGAALALLSHFGRYGTPLQILSDRGSQFTSEVIKKFLLLVRTEHRMTMSYAKEENSIVERANKEVMRHIRTLVFDTNVLEDWCIGIPIAQRIINASVHSSTGISPAAMLFGNAIDLDRNIFEATPPITGVHSKPVSSFVDNMLHVQSKLFEIARTKLTEHDEIHLKIPKQGVITTYQIGDLVLVEHHSSFRRGPKSKLMPFLRGPLRIINISGEQGDTYTLQDIVNNRQRSYHISKLRPYDHDPNKHDPLEAAIRDDQYHIIDSIKSFKETGDKQRHLKTNFTFKVHWKGYKTSEDSWEPYLNIKNTKVFYDFIKDNKNPRLRKLLPKNLIFTEEVEEIVSEDDNDTL